MGNSTGLAYDVLNSIQYTNNCGWQINQGSTKPDVNNLKQDVTIFRFFKSSGGEKMSLVQKNIQKLKILRHPYVLNYIDSVELEDSVVLVTESCIPLEKWISNLGVDTTISQQNIFSELTWGFKCVLQALDFLHSNGNIIHGNLGLQSIFVTPNGDWKLGSFELATNVSNNDELNHFLTHQFILDNNFISPERLSLRDRNPSKIDEVLKAKVPPYYIDMYSFGQLVIKTFQLCKEDLKGSFEKHILLTINSEIRKRPVAKKLSQTAAFSSDYIKILENVQEFSVKLPKEILEVISQLEPLLPQMTFAVCAYKLIPGVCKVLQIAINEFQNRDLRESSRQAIVVCIELVSKLCSMKKLTPEVYQKEFLGIVVQLWAMTDRTVRTTLLSSLKNMADFIPNSAINKQIFDNVLAGFTDSNAKLRETTLMSLIHIVDKLDETQLQDRLVRCICNLQGDPEASIRTNTTIFIGKIAPKLKDAVRNRVLSNSLAKSMKDNFLHCRIAGLKTAVACIKLLEITQLATKIIPQCSILLLDKSKDIRILALNLMEISIDRMKSYHEILCETDGKEDSKEAIQRNNSSSELPNSGPPSSNDSSWASWSVLQGVSKSLETNQSKDSIESHSPAPKSTETNTGSGLTPKSFTENTSISFGFKDEPPKPSLNNKSSTNISSSINAWDDDLDSALDLDNDNQNNADDLDDSFTSSFNKSNSLVNKNVLPKKEPTGLQIKSNDINTNPSKPGSVSKSATKKAKEVIAVKKLDFSKEEDNWEDF